MTSEANLKTNYMALKAAGHAFFRMTNQVLDCSLVRTHIDRISCDEEWYPTWRGVGEYFRDSAEKSMREGRSVSAGQLFTKASLAYHFAQYLHFSNLEEKNEASSLKVDCYTRALDLQPWRGIRVNVPFEDLSLPAIFRTPTTADKAPLVVLVCGSDSSKEEHFVIEREFLSRGMATVSFDGPGQGEVAQLMPMRPDYHRAVSAVIDSAGSLEGLDLERIGVIGFGFGGKLAVGAAATDRRIRACVSASGYFDMSVMNWQDPIRSWRFAHLVGVSTLDEARRAAEAYTLEPLIGFLHSDLLVLHGGMDAGIPAAAAKRIADCAGVTAEFVIVEGGVHCFHNVSWKTNPLICDWMLAHFCSE